MGFFKSIGKAFGKAMETLGNYVGSETVSNWGRGIQDKCEEKSKEVASQTSETNEYDKETASVTETLKINKILAQFSLDLQTQADELEEECLNTMNIYFSEIYSVLEKEESLKVNTKQLNLAQNKLEKNVSGTIKKHLAKRVSLDDEDCLFILKSPPGQEKEGQMLRFARQVFSESLVLLANEVKEVVDNQYESIHDHLQDKMSEVLNILTIQSYELSKIEGIKKSNESQLLKEQQNIKETTALYQSAIDYLKSTG